MKFLRLLSRLIDELNIFVGQVSIWMILASTLISAGNALARYSFGIGSNALLEIQWYLFAAVFTLGAGYAFLRNVHVRIDFLANKFSARGRNWVDVIGIIVFLFPLFLLEVKTYQGILKQVYSPIFLLCFHHKYVQVL